jgi:pimeloyl-ACP methyl ester carboxylesterase
MSTSGATHLPAASPRVRRQLTKTAPSDVDAYVEHALTTWHLIGSPEFAPPESELRSRIRVAFERSYYPAGFRRQLAAIVASGSREDLLPSIKVPTLVIHGKADQLVPVQGGIHTASLIPGAELELIDGMGHDLPPALLPRIADRIIGHVSRPRPSPPPAESQRTGAETDRTGA